MTSDRAFDVPADRHYDPLHHLWAKWDPGSRRVRVGIDALGLESLGELAYVALQEVGSEVERGGSLGTLEAAKMTSNIAAPVSGRITARNDAVLADPLTVNDSPYDRGWLVEIAPSDWPAESAELMSDPAAIDAWVTATIERFEADAR